MKGKNKTVRFKAAPKYRALKKIMITATYRDEKGIDRSQYITYDYDGAIVVTDNGWSLVMDLHAVKGKKKQFLVRSIPFMIEGSP